jgi:hypothetical protein
MLFDSMARSEIDDFLGQNTANILIAERKAKGYTCIVYRLQKTQKQKAYYCGYFPPFFVAAICYDLDPELLLFDEHELRKHFIETVLWQAIDHVSAYTQK